jgi:diadenosine tetraphosphatase ApaH/serine/threonine PP2A family protein phosphatase
MRILLLSDIHANFAALEAVLRAAPPHDGVWCLGDVVGYGPKPNECVARLRQLEVLTLTGNHDQAALGNVPLELFRDTARQALEWTRRALTADTAAWLAARPTTHQLRAYDLTLVHASPRDPLWEYIDKPKTAYENMAYLKTAYGFFGHTHQPAAYHLLRDGMLVKQSVTPGMPLSLDLKFLFNPGSVGQPRDGDPRAAFALYDSTAGTVTLHRVAYDVAATQRAMQQALLPIRLAERLEKGT